MKTAFILCLVILGTLTSQGADYPSVEVLRPNSSDHLQPGSAFRLEWQVSATNHLDHGDWNFLLETNGVLVGRFFLNDGQAIYDGNGRWHAELVLPDRVPKFTRWDEVLVDLPSSCHYKLHIHEDVTEADGRSAVFCLGVPILNVRVSQVEVCWNARSNRLYQLQFQSSATTNVWTNLGSSILGNGSTNCVTDTLLPGQPQRLYRIQELP